MLGWVTRTKKEGAEINKNHRASTPNPAPEPVRTVFIFNLKHCAPILIMKWICSDPQVHKTFVLIVSNNANVVQVEIRKKGNAMGKNSDAKIHIAIESFLLVCLLFSAVSLCVSLLLVAATSAGVVVCIFLPRTTVNDINILFGVRVCLFVVKSYIISSTPTFVKCATLASSTRIDISANKRIYV